MDKYNLQRFVDAQHGYDFYTPYETALREIESGRKYSHWIWYVFPQLYSLGRSSTAKKFGIRDLNEARAYMEHPQLGENLLKIARALLESECSNAVFVMNGNIDAVKLRSSMTLFAEAVPECAVFQKVLDKFFGGEKDTETLRLLKSE